MDELVERVNETRRICKALLNRGLLNEDKYRTIVASPRPQDRMKQILHALSSKGQQGREALYRLLQEHEPELTLQMGVFHSKHFVFVCFFVPSFFYSNGTAHSILFIPFYSLFIHTHTHLKI